MPDHHCSWSPVALLLLSFSMTLVGCPKKQPNPVSPGEPPPKYQDASTKTAEPARATPPRMITDKGFMTPESVLFDPLQNKLLVSNINGGPLDIDGNGFISQLSDSGELMELQWIDGAAKGTTLNAPKGMAVAGDTLYVADITHLRLFNRESGAPLSQIEIPGATFLNDVVAAEDKTIYVSDSGMTQGFQPSGTDAIWRIPPGGKPEILIKGTDLGRPNGLALDGKELVVVTLGTGEVYRIDREKKRSPAKKPPGGSLDGVVRIAEHTFLISSWEAKTVYRLRPDGVFETVIDKINSPADIGYNSKLKELIIPLFNDNALMIVQL